MYTEGKFTSHVTLPDKGGSSVPLTPINSRELINLVRITQYNNTIAQWVQCDLM